MLSAQIFKLEKTRWVHRRNHAAIGQVKAFGLSLAGAFMHEGGDGRPCENGAISAFTVRRGKAALSSGCKPHPAKSLQPEATGAVVEVTKWLKPSDSGPRIGGRRECTGRNVCERRASLEKDDVQADPTGVSGKADMAGRYERRRRPVAAPGYWRQHVHKESVRNTGSPRSRSGMTNRTPARDRPGGMGWRRGA